MPVNVRPSISAATSISDNVRNTVGRITRDDSTVRAHHATLQNLPHDSQLRRLRHQSPQPPSVILAVRPESPPPLRQPPLNLHESPENPESAPPTLRIPRAPRIPLAPRIPREGGGPRRPQGGLPPVIPAPPARHSRERGNLEPGAPPTPRLTNQRIPSLLRGGGRGWGRGGAPSGQNGASTALTRTRRQIKLYCTYRAEVAQVVEHATENRGVGSSTLPLGTCERERRAGAPCRRGRLDVPRAVVGWSVRRKWRSGSASPCQGEGRGFKSRLPLHSFFSEVA